ncbi:hypothetical protein Bpfe_011857 [Biomphalaria pfeifferi]|uniref:Uncharacterized protein n=1 Tax=Biomphalaria pfeifferi TaxID=112525 RepID=A0AAD8FBJ2_BIOPF|nr:hypothetical protein Bpfe_011857 [Biomphalaria pfeifferi]
MSIIDRSYFSATCSPHLYTYLNGLLIGRKDKRGLNANKLQGIGHSDVLNLAFFVSYALWDRSEYCQEILPLSKVYELRWNKDTMPGLENSQAPRGAIPDSNDSIAKRKPQDLTANGIFRWIDFNKGRLPLLAIKSLLVMLCDDPMRPNSLGE